MLGVEQFLSERYGIEEESELSVKNDAQLMDQMMIVATMLQEPRELRPLQPVQEPLANSDALEKASEKGWLLPSSVLAPLLNLKRVQGDVIERYGFRCERIGKTGRESEWKIAELRE